jgi:hypothetical protein
MTRYEIIRGITPPPEPPAEKIEYVMGIDPGMRSDTACCICHEKNGCMHVDEIRFIPPGEDNLRYTLKRDTGQIAVNSEKDK